MKKNLPTLSIVVPAYNEEKNLQPVCDTILKAAPCYFSGYEVIIIDDASTDGTWAVAQKLAREQQRIQVYHNSQNKGLGFNYYLGVEKARFQYVMLVPGDNEVSAFSLENIFSEVGTADILVTYTANWYIRPLIRQAISWLYTRSINLLFGLSLRYYNGINVIRTELVRRCPPSTNGFAYMALILVQLLKGKAGTIPTYAHVPFMIQPRPHGVTKAFRFKNICSVMAAVARLWVTIYWTKR